MGWQEQRGTDSEATTVRTTELATTCQSKGRWFVGEEAGGSRKIQGTRRGGRGRERIVTPEGEEVSIQYVADETGFHATGSHVPQAPPMPPAIRRMLDHLAKVNGHAKLY